MESGIRIKWGKLVPGREKLAVEVFTDVMTYYGKKLADGKITYFEPFFTSTTDFGEELGFIIVKAPSEYFASLAEDEEYLTLLDKGSYVVDHLKVDYLLVGEAVTAQLQRAERVRELLKI